MAENYRASIERDTKDYSDAMDENTSPDRLVILSKSPRWFIKEAVINNPNTPLETLRAFLGGKSEHLQLLAEKKIREKI